MKKLCLTIAMMIFSISIIAQQRLAGTVTDPALYVTIATEAALEASHYEKIEENERKTIELKATAVVLQENIKNIQKTTLEYMQNVQAILRDLYSLEIIVQTGTRIVNNLGDAGEMVVDDPMMAAVVAELMVRFGDETIELYQYIDNIVRTEGNHNLLSNSERLTIITHVKMEMYKLQGLSSQMVYRIKAAKRHGLFQTLCPRTWMYVRRTNTLANNIINNFHL